MTSLASLIEKDIVTPNERGPSKLIWWAYIHAYDGTVKVKRWWPLEGTDDDLTYAKQEKAQGNNNILVLLEKPFTADSSEARERARELLEQQLLQEGLRVRRDPARTPPLYLASILDNNDRFRYIEID